MQPIQHRNILNAIILGPLFCLLAFNHGLYKTMYVVSMTSPGGFWRAFFNPKVGGAGRCHLSSWQSMNCSSSQIYIYLYILVDCHFESCFCLYFQEFSSDEGLCAKTCLQNKKRFLPASRFFHSLYSTSAAGFVYVFYENAKAALFHTIKVGKSSFRKDKKLQNS